MTNNIYISMKDLATKCSLPKKTSIVCLNDQEQFSCEPIGLPIKYYPSIIESKSGDYINKQLITKLKELNLKWKILR